MDLDAKLGQARADEAAQPWVQTPSSDLYPGDWSTLAIQSEHGSNTRGPLRRNRL